MTPTLKTISPGVHTSVQDFGRTGFRNLGVPTSGALDRTALRLANHLVGNSARTAGLEILYMGPVFEVHADAVRIALSGSGCTIELLGDSSQIFPAWQSVRLTRGQAFKITINPGLSCCYLAVEGGFDLAPVMSSLSTYTRAAFGGFNGRILRSNDALPLKLNTVNEHLEQIPGRLILPPTALFASPGANRQTASPPASREGFVAHEYTILPASDRMGYRLSGFEIRHKDSFNIVSDGTAVGAIQVPGDGAPIILLADCQTTGGYPKIATVISSDLGLLARHIPGHKIRFQVITLAEAETIAREQDTATGKIEKSRLAVQPAAKLDIDALYETNLISGIIDAKY